MGFGDLQGFEVGMGVLKGVRQGGWRSHRESFVCRNWVTLKIVNRGSPKGVEAAAPKTRKTYPENWTALGRVIHLPPKTWGGGGNFLTLPVCENRSPSNLKSPKPTKAEERPTTTNIDLHPEGGVTENPMAPLQVWKKPGQE